jgi:peptidoglycan/LPS O-acetylase OafA/YrhL
MAWPKTTMRENNLDLIRLIAALQVLIIHLHDFFKLDTVLYDILRLFPGVPIFFFISGYLIYQSWNNLSDKPHRYAINRALRLYPALWTCFAVTLLSVYLTGYFNEADFTWAGLGVWAVAQLTLFQFYHSNIFSGYGIGILNGSLWTISVEIQFYIIMPILALIMAKYRKLSFALFGLLIIFNIINAHFNPRDAMIEKLFHVSFLPWLYMFMVGAFIAKSEKIQTFILNQNIFLTIGFYIASYMIADHWNLGTGNGINPVSFLIMACAILKLAYMKPSLSSILLRRTDMSYGIYIYHVPVINWMMYMGYEQGYVNAAMAFAVTILLGYLSWVLVERPALSLKKSTIFKR